VGAAFIFFLCLFLWFLFFLQTAKQRRKSEKQKSESILDKDTLPIQNQNLIDVLKVLDCCKNKVFDCSKVNNS